MFPPCLPRSELHNAHPLAPLRKPPHQIRHIETLPGKTHVKTNQQGRERTKRKKKTEREGKTNPERKKKEDIIESWRLKDTNDEGRFSKWPLPFGRPVEGVKEGFFTASSFWRRSRWWRRRAGLGPARQTGGWHCLLCFLVSSRRIQKAWRENNNNNKKKESPEVSVHPHFAHIDADVFVETYFTEPPPSLPHLKQEGVMIKLLRNTFWVIGWLEKRFLLPVLGIDVTVGYRVDGIVPPEEESAARGKSRSAKILIKTKSYSLKSWHNCMFCWACQGVVLQNDHLGSPEQKFHSD